MALKKKKIGVVVTSRADYGRLKPVIDLIKKTDNLELKLMVATSLFTDNFFLNIIYSDKNIIRKSFFHNIKIRLLSLFKIKDTNQLEYLTRQIIDDGLNIDIRIPMFIQGMKNEHMVRVSGLASLSMSKILKDKPVDVLLVHGDRFELLPIVMSAVYVNIPVAHIEGGDVSGTIDNSIRYSISKLSHIHFPVTELSKKRLIDSGEKPESIIISGSPIIDYLKSIDLNIKDNFFSQYGSEGGNIDFLKPYILAIFHPVTTEYEKSRFQMKEFLSAIKELNLPTLILSPNIDGGSDHLNEMLRKFVKDNLKNIAFRKNLSPEDFYRVLSKAKVAVGNSSSFIRETSFLGVPSVLVGSRQNNREKGHNVIEVDVKKDDIILAVKKQVNHGFYEKSNLFGDGRASEIIVESLSKIDFDSFNTQKNFF
jgi:UDP-hydrolysing UDP-N-acetyl-D-glucosamine 2-epimerase